MPITNQDIAKKLYSSQALGDIKKVEKKDRLHTGISGIDNDFGFPTGYYVIIGNQGVGKSWFALWLARMFYRHDLVNSVFFSLEMAKQFVTQRILQQWSDLTKTQFESNESVDQAVNLLAQDVIVVDEFHADNTALRTPKNFEMWVDEYYKMGYRVFIMDHFHELGGASTNDTNQKTVEVWGNLFQKVCKKYTDIWLIIFAQPNSSDYNKKILNRNSLRGSKALIDKCDYVLTLNRNFETDEETGAPINDPSNNKTLIYLDKSRFTTNPNILFRVVFTPTGNFNSTTGGAQ